MGNAWDSAPNDRLVAACRKGSCQKYLVPKHWLGGLGSAGLQERGHYTPTYTDAGLGQVPCRLRWADGVLLVERETDRS